MGTDPLLGASPLSVPGLLAVVLLALAATTGPVLRGHEVSPAQIRTDRLASVAVLFATVTVVFTETTGGLHGFIMVTGLVSMAAATLLRTRTLPAL